MTKITASEEAMINRAINNFVNGTEISGDPISKGIKHLVDKYSENIIVSSRDKSYLVRNFGDDLLEYIATRTDVMQDQLPTILNYFASIDHAVAAATDVIQEEMNGDDVPIVFY